MINKLIKLSIFSIGCLMVTACEHQPKVKISGGGVLTPVDSTNNPTNCDPDTVYFVNEILPMITSNCAQAGCHDAITRAEGVRLDAYNYIKAYTKAGSASTSKLYKEIANGNMPPNGSMTADQKAKLQKWINQGAKNNYCNSGCDSTLFTYSGAITKIINTNCIACHNSGTVLLNSYTNVKTMVDNGRFLGAIKHLSGFQPMPSANMFLSACDTKKIAKWIAAGAPNN